MNRVEFQNWLNKFPEDTIIEVGLQQDPPMYHAYGEVIFVEFTGGEDDMDYEYVDFENNQFVGSDKPYYGKKFLRLGDAS